MAAGGKGPAQAGSTPLKCAALFFQKMKGHVDDGMFFGTSHALPRTGQGALQMLP